MATTLTNQIKIYSECEVDVKTLLDACERVKHGEGNPGRKNKPTYINMVCAFDIETTYLQEFEQSIMYVWQMQMGPYIIMGRTWDEWLALLQRIRDSIKKSERVVCYIHNASFEFQFIRGIYPFTPKEVFVMDRRKIARFEMYGAVEFRCSYIHSNMSLDQFTKKMGCTVRKLTGEFDYSKRRFPWTELTEDELMYCVNDVISLCEAIEIEMRVDGDNLETIPLTSTGYVRRKCKAALKKKPAFHSYITEQLPDYELYLALRRAFRGGNTHCNRFYAGEIIANVYSVDRSSSYPDVLVNHEYPVSGFVHRGPLTWERFLYNKDTMKRAMVFDMSLTNVRLRNRYEGCPYLSKDKCENITGAYFDNGRILYANTLTTCCTDVDFRIIESMYEWDSITIDNAWCARYGPLPKEFTDVIISMYQDKTALKGGDAEQQIYYEKIKAMINALYCRWNDSTKSLKD